MEINKNFNPARRVTMFKELCVGDVFILYSDDTHDEYCGIWLKTSHEDKGTNAFWLDASLRGFMERDDKVIKLDAELTVTYATN